MATKASTAGKKGASARTRSSSSRSTSRRNARDTKTGTEPPRRSVEEHSEHPESPGDSTVRHADNPVGRKSAGAGGFPQGEYDPTVPAKRGAVKKDPVQLAIEQELDADEIETIKAAIKHPKANRLKPEQRALAIEALPIGTILEHEGKFRWRVKGSPTGGGNRFGHGSTAQEAIDAYILGSSTQTLADAGAEAFSNLPPKQQKEIEERDAKVAKRMGIAVDNLPGVAERNEFLENQRAARGAKAPASNATTDGPEVASAQLEAGARRGRGEANEARKAEASSNRKSASRRVRSGKAGSKK